MPFYKRAQLTAADLAVAFGGEGWGCYRDLDRLTCFADNLVPHVLRCAQVLVYAPSLARRIDAGELLAAGSPEEVEIRAGAVHAVERWVAEPARGVPGRRRSSSTSCSGTAANEPRSRPIRGTERGRRSTESPRATCRLLTGEPRLLRERGDGVGERPARVLLKPG